MSRWTAIFVLALGAGMIGPDAQAAGPTAVAGVPAAAVGIHGPVSNHVFGPLELIGNADMTPVGGTLPLGNNGGLALIDDCAYVGRWHDYGGRNGVQIVDISDPATPEVIGAVPDTAIRGAVAREIRAVDLSNGFKLLTVLTFSTALPPAPERGLNGLLFYTFPSGDCTRPVLAGRLDLRPFVPHEFFQWLDPDPAHNVDGHPRILEFVSTPVSGTDVVVVDASRPEKPRLAGAWNAGFVPASLREGHTGPVPVGPGVYTHSISVSPDGRRAFVSHWDGGYFSVDTSLFAAGAPGASFLPAGLASVPLHYRNGGVGNTHSAVPVPGRHLVVVGDEDYVTGEGCPFGWMHIVDPGGLVKRPVAVGEFGLPENHPDGCGADGLVKDRNALGLRLDGTFSMHNQTVTQQFVLASWYGGGLRVVDIADPARPSEIAFFVPAPLEQISSMPETDRPVYGATGRGDDDWRVSMWSYPVIRDGLIYVVDIRNGLYVLRPAPGSRLASELSSTGFAEGNSNRGWVR